MTAAKVCLYCDRELHRMQTMTCSERCAAMVYGYALGQPGFVKKGTFAAKAKAGVALIALMLGMGSAYADDNWGDELANQLQGQAQETIQNQVQQNNVVWRIHVNQQLQQQQQQAIENAQRPIGDPAYMQGYPGYR